MGVVDFRFVGAAVFCSVFVHRSEGIPKFMDDRPKQHQRTTVAVRSTQKRHATQPKTWAQVRNGGWSLFVGWCGGDKRMAGLGLCLGLCLGCWSDDEGGVWISFFVCLDCLD